MNSLFWQVIEFDAHVLGRVENRVIDLTYLAEPHFRGWGSCGQAAFDWIDDGIKCGWDMAVSGDPLDLTGKIYFGDQIAPGTYPTPIRWRATPPGKGTM